MFAYSLLLPSFVSVKLTENGKGIFPLELNDTFSLSQNKEKNRVSLFVCSFIWQAKFPKHLNFGSDQSYYSVFHVHLSHNNSGSLHRPAGNEMQWLRVPDDWIRERVIA